MLKERELEGLRSCFVMRTTATRFHDVSFGHRVVGHEGKCALWHGHNYRIHFTCVAVELDKVGRVIDFSVMKAKLCMWLEENWDHKFLAWEHDKAMQNLKVAASAFHGISNEANPHAVLVASLVWVPFNPTAEHIGQHLLNVVGPQQLEGTGVRLVKVVVDETRRCSASVEEEIDAS